MALLSHFHFRGMDGEGHSLLHDDPGLKMGLSSYLFILGFLLVFRTNKAYTRWWEGGMLLQGVRGEWFNAYSNLLAFTTRDAARQEQVDTFQHKLLRLVSLLFCAGLQQVATMENKCFEIIELHGMDRDSLTFLQETGVDRCEVIMQWVQRLIIDAMDDRLLDVPPPILSRCFHELSLGIVSLTNAKKIIQFPFPFPYAQMLTIMLIMQWVGTPLVIGAMCQHPISACVLTFTIVLCFWGINYIACEIESPFGDDGNDLPLKELQHEFNASLLNLLKEPAKRAPEFTQVFSEGCSNVQIKMNDSHLNMKTKSLLEEHETSRGRITFTLPLPTLCPTSKVPVWSPDTSLTFWKPTEDASRCCPRFPRSRPVRKSEVIPPRPPTEAISLQQDQCRFLRDRPGRGVQAEPLAEDREASGAQGMQPIAAVCEEASAQTGSMESGAAGSSGTRIGGKADGHTSDTSVSAGMAFRPITQGNREHADDAIRHLEPCEQPVLDEIQIMTTHKFHM